MEYIFVEGSGQNLNSPKQILARVAVENLTFFQVFTKSVADPYSESVSKTTP